MTETPGGPRGDRAGDGLPDYTRDTQEREVVAPAGDRHRSRARAVLIAVIGASVVLIAVVALVLSQTAFRGVMDDDPPVTAAPSQGTASGQPEYIPDPNDPNLAPPPPIFTQTPTKPCAVMAQQSTSPQSPGVSRGGGLEFTVPSTWKRPWSNGNLSYVTDAAGYGRNVEGSWYSAANVARVAWPEDQGAYPGAESAAITIFQCYATSANLIQEFGDKPEVTDYRSEATTVDGVPGWIVQATYHFDNSSLKTTDQSIVTSLVVDTPGGPSVLVSDVAADHPDHVQELSDIIASLKVVS